MEVMMSNAGIKLIEGTTAQCWEHFRTTVNQWEDGSQAIQLEKSLGAYYADELGVCGTGFDIFIQDKNIPRGEDLIRLRYFLESLGYSVIEMEELSPVVYRLGLLISLSKLSATEASKRLGFEDRDSLIKVLRGARPTSDKREQAIKVLLDGFGGESRTASVDPESRLPNGHKELLALCASLITGMRPLLTLLTSDGFTPEERASLRLLVGEAGVFELSNLIAALCSETARARLLDGQAYVATKNQG